LTENPFQTFPKPSSIPSIPLKPSQSSPTSNQSHDTQKRKNFNLLSISSSSPSIYPTNNHPQKPLTNFRYVPFRKFTSPGQKCSFSSPVAESAKSNTEIIEFRSCGDQATPSFTMRLVESMKQFK
jgi:hypothetical protein